MGKMPSWRRSKSGLTKSSVFKNARKIARIRNSKKPSRMLVRNWKRQMLLLCFAKLWRRIVGVMLPIKTRQNLRVIWTQVNLQDCVWENLNRLIMKTILREKGVNSLQLYNLVHKYIPMPQAMQIPAAKSSSGQGMGNNGEFRRGTWQKSKVRREVIDQARTSGATVHFASLMDICHLKNAELEEQHQKYKGRVVLRGDSVKDDSGSYAVFTEQGSSASQMTAAKVMDIISRLPGCDGQAADAVSAFIPK